MKIKLRNINVLTTVKENKQNHIKEYEKQLNGWKKKMKEHNELMVKWAEGGGSEERPREPFKPTNYTKDYDKNIELLNAHEDDFIELEEYEYDTLIKDKFQWKSGFLATSNMYVGGN